MVQMHKLEEVVVLQITYMGVLEEPQLIQHLRPNILIYHRMEMEEQEDQEVETRIVIMVTIQRLAKVIREILGRLDM